MNEEDEVKGQDILVAADEPEVVVAEKPAKKAAKPVEVGHRMAEEEEQPNVLVADDELIKLWLSNRTIRLKECFDIVKVSGLYMPYPGKVFSMLMDAVAPGGKLLVLKEYKGYPLLNEKMKPGKAEGEFFAFLK